MEATRSEAPSAEILHLEMRHLQRGGLGAVLQNVLTCEVGRPVSSI